MSPLHSSSEQFVKPAFMPPANFCKAKKPFGLGYDPEVIDRIRTEERDITVAQLAAEAEPLKPHGGDRKSDNKVDTSTLKGSR